MVVLYARPSLIAAIQYAKCNPLAMGISPHLTAAIPSLQLFSLPPHASCNRNVI